MTLLHDLRFAARSFAKTPGVTIAVVLSIALGIAATTSVFTLVNALLFKPMPVAHPDQLVALYTTEPDPTYPSSFSFPEYREYRDHASGLFADLFAYNNQSLGFSADGQKSELIYGMKTMPMFLDRLLSLPASVAAIVALFAMIALVMAAVGLYGVFSYSTARRTREIGLRMAIGADRGDVMRMVLKGGLTLATVGVGIGTLGALALMRLTARLLYGVGPNDPLTYLSAVTLLAVVALVASCIPARRAMRLEPTIALRCE